MTRYAYQQQLVPPAPFVKVVLRNPAGGAELLDQPAQLDSAADRTVIPAPLVRALALPQVGIMNLVGLGGAVFTLPVYAVMLGVHDFPARLIKVASHAEESWMLLGRDILNNYRVVLDGPQLFLEIE